MISLRYFILILLVGAYFTSTLAEEAEDETEAPADGDGDEDETEAPADGEEEETEAPADEEGEEDTEAPADEEEEEDTEAPAGEEEEDTEAPAEEEEETTEAGGGDDGTTAAPTPAPTQATRPPKCRACYRNQNGMCRSFDVACRKIGKNLRDRTGIIWRMSPRDCAKRKANKVKVCSSDCPRFKNANCRPARNPVCGYSANRRMCRLYPSICHLKKNACNNPRIGDWRVARMARCNGLQVGARAVPC